MRSGVIPLRSVYSFLVSGKMFSCYGMNESAWRHGFRDHNESVIRFFVGTDKLLVHNIFEGDGFDKLCTFLDKAVPRKSYPFVKKGVEKKRGTDKIQII